MYRLDQPAPPETRTQAQSSQSSMTGRTVLVTGAGSGLGRAIACEFHAQGASVAVADIDGDAARATAELCGDGAGAFTLDVRDSDSVAAVVDSLGATYGAAFDCLINNAGTDRGASLIDIEDDAWHSVFGVNLHGPMYASRAFLRHVLAQPWDEQEANRPADILNIVSISALTVGAGAGAYNASKAALLKLTEVLQTEVRENGWPVRVSAIHPSAMDTPMMKQWNVPAERLMDPAAVARLVRVAVTLPPDMVLSSATITGRREYFPR